MHSYPEWSPLLLRTKFCGPTIIQILIIEWSDFKVKNTDTQNVETNCVRPQFQNFDFQCFFSSVTSPLNSFYFYATVLVQYSQSDIKFHTHCDIRARPPSLVSRLEKLGEYCWKVYDLWQKHKVLAKIIKVWIMIKSHIQKRLF